MSASPNAAVENASAIETTAVAIAICPKSSGDRNAAPTRKMSALDRFGTTVCRSDHSVPETAARDRPRVGVWREDLGLRRSGERGSSRRPQHEPRAPSTTGTVRMRITQSRAGDHSAT